MSLNRNIERGFTMLKHSVLQKPKMRKSMWLLRMITSKRFMLRRNHRNFNVLRHNIYPIMRKGAFNA
jgi:hypothetical protein